MRMFGMDGYQLEKIELGCNFTIEINPGDIIFITGPSGTGKTTILNEIYKRILPAERIALSDIEIPNDKAVIDSLGLWFTESLGYFTTAGLAGAKDLLNRPDRLSEGQQWRFRLASALASGKKYIFADEFCSTLDRITASDLSYNIRKFADRYKATFILASAHQDILDDLRPDAIVERNFLNDTIITYKDSERACHS